MDLANQKVRCTDDDRRRELVPVSAVMDYLRANEFRTYIVTGGGQEFVRVYAQHVYGVSPEQFPPHATTLDYVVAAAGG